MNRVQKWVTRRLETLRGRRMSALGLRDMADDRLADVQRLLSDDVHWYVFEQELVGQLMRASGVPAKWVRIDTTAASSSADVDDKGRCDYRVTAKITVPICLNASLRLPACTPWACHGNAGGVPGY
jgi:hypothetical protein